MGESVSSWLAVPMVSNILLSAAIILIVVVLVRTAQRILGRYIDDSSRRYRARKVVTFFGYLLLFFLLSIVFQEKLSGFTVFFGVVGAGVAFALQELIASVAGWVAVSFGHFYTVGDRIQLGGITGDVIDIGMLRTTLMECGGWINGDQYNGRVVRISNSFVFKEPVFNYSSDFPFLWDEISIPVRYGSNYEKARSGFLRILEEVTGEHARQLKNEWRKMTDKYMVENAQLEPMVTFEIRENWTEYLLRYVVDYKQRRITKDKIGVRILKLVEESGDEIVLGASPFEVASIPSLDINIGNKSKPSQID